MDHREACLLLVDYVKGELEEERAAAVAAHVAAHAECRATVDFLVQLQSDLERRSVRSQLEHPDADDLVAYATGNRDALDAAVSGAIERHAETCPECAAHLLATARAHDATVSPAAAIRSETGRGRATPVWIGMALAAGLALGFLIPRHQGASPAGGPTAVIHLSGDVRGSGAGPVGIAPSVGMLSFIVAMDPWIDRETDDDFTLHIVVTDPQGNAVWSLDTTARSAWNAGSGFLSVVAPADAIGAGRRRFSVQDGDGTRLFSAEFELTRP